MSKKKIIVAIVLLLALFLGFFWYQSEQQYRELLRIPASTNAELKLTFTIRKGETAKEIAFNLQKRGIITDASAFIRYIREKELEKKLYSGPFILRPAETIPEIVQVLTGEKKIEIALNIPEGFTIKQIDERLKEKELISGNEFLDCIEKCTFDSQLLALAETKNPEGFLFPATYDIATPSFDVRSFIQQLLQTCEKRLAPYLKDIPEGKLYDVIIMASLIERETNTEEERPIVAGILWKRLENHWYLGVDATLRYYMNDWTNPLTYKDLQDNNPYNTRTHLGLPPTPIANPGISSLKAAIYPTDTEYWYYLHDKNGIIRYAKTNQEHALNKVKYLSE